MDLQIRQIREFNNKFKTVDPSSPTADIDSRYAEVRKSLMQEELAELMEAMDASDLEHITKEISDLLYVVIGTASAYGLLDILARAFTEVHRSNMSKTHVEGKPKPQKLEGYFKADMSGVISGAQKS